MRTWRPLTLLIAALRITGRSLAVNVYEHGYNLFKCHKLVFGSEKVWHWDNAGMAHFEGDWFSAGKVLDISILPSALKVLVPNG